MNRVEHPTIDAETLILRTPTVTDPAALAARPDEHLVSIRDEPAAAADLWRDRVVRHGYGSDGLVRVTYQGQDLMTADMWDDVDGIWACLVYAADAVRKGTDWTGSFRAQPLDVSVTAKPHGATLTIGDVRTFVQADGFCPGLLAAAGDYYRWVDQVVGENRRAELNRIERLLRAS